MDKIEEMIFKNHSIYGLCNNHAEHLKKYLAGTHKTEHEMWQLAFQTFLFKV